MTAAAYDPSNELVISYEEAAGLRTRRVRAAEESDSPKLVWFFEMKRRKEEEPESLPEDLPQWFHDLIQKLEAIEAEYDRGA